MLEDLESAWKEIASGGVVEGPSAVYAIPTAQIKSASVNQGWNV